MKLKETGVFIAALNNLAIFLLVVIPWIAGIVLAVGWMKLIATCIPFYAWYLVVEKIMIAQGWI